VKEKMTAYGRDISTSMFVMALFTIAQLWDHRIFKVPDLPPFIR
jgi:hypothetical protein